MGEFGVASGAESMPIAVVLVLGALYDHVPRERACALPGELRAMMRGFAPRSLSERAPCAPRRIFDRALWNFFPGSADDGLNPG